MSANGPRQRAPAKPKESPGLLSLAVWTALVLLAVLALTLLLELVSTGPPSPGSPTHALAAVAAVTAALLVLCYPLWPSPLLGDGRPRGRFRRWFGLRMLEVLMVLAVAVPFMVAGAVVSGAPFSRVPDLLAGLSGTALAGVAYRFVHRACSRSLCGLAVVDAMAFLFGPLIAGYLLLEFYRVSIGWGWLISPLALAPEVARHGLPLGGAAFWVGVVGYLGVSALGLVLLRGVAGREG